MEVLLVSTYELGRQPFGLASPAAWLRAAGHQVTCLDLSLERIPEVSALQAGLIGFYLPMHTATRLAHQAIATIRAANPKAHFCCFGLYAALNAEYLSKLGIHTSMGGEFEEALVKLAASLEGGASVEPANLISTDRLQFIIPDRSGLPPLERYAKLHSHNTTSVAGYTEASRGCKHLCRHCPVVPVYKGAFRVVQQEIVIADIRQQVAAGAGHITFGDPDFFNGPAHAMRIVEAMHREFPEVSYDATIKIEHLRKHSHLVRDLKRTGCLFVTTAVESVDDPILQKLDKGHSVQDFIEVVAHFRQVDLALAPTFIPFTPWTTVGGYRDLLGTLSELNLIEHVSPVQLALRLLIPGESRLLELEDIQAVITQYDEPALLHRWVHPDTEVDVLADRAMHLAMQHYGSRREHFAAFWELAYGFELPDQRNRLPRAAIPYMDEPWYC